MLMPLMWHNSNVIMKRKQRVNSCALVVYRLPDVSYVMESSANLLNNNFVSLYDFLTGKSKLHFYNKSSNLSHKSHFVFSQNKTFKNGTNYKSRFCFDHFMWSYKFSKLPNCKSTSWQILWDIFKSLQQKCSKSSMGE